MKITLKGSPMEIKEYMKKETCGNKSLIKVNLSQNAIITEQKALDMIARRVVEKLQFDLQKYKAEAY